MDHLAIAGFLTRLLEAEFSFLGLKFGLDALFGVFPILGDIIPFALAFYLIWIAKKYEVPAEKIAIMVRNIVIDFLLGLIPVVGDVADFFYKANLKNLSIIHEHVGRPPLIEAKVLR